MPNIADQLRDFAGAKNPRFVSGPAVIPLRHLLLPGANGTQIQWLATQTKGASEVLIDFYRTVNGARLFANQADEEECFFFLPIEDMEAEKKGLDPWIMPRTDEPDYEYGEELSDDGRLDLFGPPPWWNSALVFGGIGYAPERYFLATEGPWRGNVFVYVHDGDYSVRTNLSFEAMLQEIITQPSKFMGWAVNYEIDRYESDAL